MSIQLVCDMCGKSDKHGPIVFNDGPLTLDVENFKGEKFEVKLTVDFKSQADNETISLAKNIAVIRDLKDVEKLTDLIKSRPMLKHPNPHICNVCTKELALTALKDGFRDPDCDIVQEKPLDFTPMGMGANMQSFSNNGVLDGLEGLPPNLLALLSDIVSDMEADFEEGFPDEEDEDESK